MARALFCVCDAGANTAIWRRTLLAEDFSAYGLIWKLSKATPEETLR